MGIRGRQLVIADIHGRFEALKEVLGKSHFNYEDTLIVLGDATDGGSESKQVLDELLKIKKLKYILGNHCMWTLHWFETGVELPVWVHQGGYATMESYGFDWKSVPESHVKLLKNAPYYFVDEKNRVYVHGGFDTSKPIEGQDPHFVMWDRNLALSARHFKSEISRYTHIFLGHTTTQALYRRDLFNPKATQPNTFNGITLCDTGAGYTGKLTILDVDTFEYWQSKTQFGGR